MPRTTTAVFACLFLAAIAIDCAAQQPAAASGVPNASGFLKDYSRLQPVPGKEGRYAWTAPTAKLKPYTHFMLPPMEIWIDRDAQYRGLSADVVERLAHIYQSSFAQVLAPNYAVVTQPGPGVATCRFAITGVTPERPAFRPRDVIPIKAAFTVIRAATGTSAQVARVSAEIECEDSVSQKPLLAAVITGVGNKNFVEGEPIKWDDVGPVLASWAQDFKARLDAVQGR